MPANNIEKVKKILLKELICGVEYHSSTHKLSFRRLSSISEERLQKIIQAGKTLGISENEIRNTYANLSFPETEVMEPKFLVKSSESKIGTVYYFECQEGNDGNIACLELMKVSSSRMLVLKSDETGLLPGDIICLNNSLFSTGGVIEASVENVPECNGQWFHSMPIKAIRIKQPSMVHQVVDQIDELEISTLTPDEDSKEILNIDNPLMAILVGHHVMCHKRNLKVDISDPQKAQDDKGEKYKAINGITEWKKYQR